jgi:AcrR family transcriptional regulator
MIKMVKRTKRNWRAEATKENIAEVASGLFAERGIANVAFDDIAKAAGYSRTTVYAHFASKDDIIHYLVLRTMENVYEATQKVIRQPMRADQQFRFLSYELINLCDEKPYYYRCMLEYIDASPEGRGQNPLLEEIYQLGEALNEDFAHIIDSGVQQGIFRDDLKVAPAGLILWSCLTTLISMTLNKRAYIESAMLSAQEFFDYGFDLILRTVLKRDV